MHFILSISFKKKHAVGTGKLLWKSSYKGNQIAVEFKIQVRFSCQNFKPDLWKYCQGL